MIVYIIRHPSVHISHRFHCHQGGSRSKKQEKLTGSLQFSLWIEHRDVEIMVSSRLAATIKRKSTAGSIPLSR